MKTKVLVIAMAVLLSTNVLAAEGKTSGVIIGNDIGRIDFSSDTQGAYGVMLGYRINRHFALVTFARSFGDFLVDSDQRGVPTNHVGLGAVGSVAVHERINLYGRIGIGRSNVRDDPSANTSHLISEASAAVGMRFALGRNFGLKLEHTSLLDSNARINTVGIDYQF